MSRLLVATYNLHDLDLSTGRDRPVLDVICDLVQLAGDHPLVLSVQEVIADAAGGPAAFAELADLVGLRPGPCARGHHIRGSGKFHWLGLLWSRGVESAGPAATFEGEMWHNLVATPVRVDGHELLAGSYHGDPFNKEDRLKEARRIAGVWAFPDHQIGWVAGDFNGLAAERQWQPDEYGGYWAADNRLDPYRPDPRKPDMGWTPAHLFQVNWTRDDRGELHWKTDRAPGEVLYTAQLGEARASLLEEPQATSGHHPNDPHGYRMVDRVHVTPRVADMLCGAVVIDTLQARVASDHLPSGAWLDLAELHAS